MTRLPVPYRSAAGWLALCAVLLSAGATPAQEGELDVLPGTVSDREGWLDALPGAAVSDRDAVIRVAPFRNMSGNPADDWIGEGIAATLDVDLAPYGSRAPERWLVRGSYQRLADRIRLTAELVDAANGRAEFATTVDGTTSELFALQDELSARLVRAAASSRPPAPARSAGSAAPAALALRPHDPVGEGIASPAPGNSGAPGPSTVEAAAPARSPGPAGSAGFAMAPAAIIHGPPPPIAPEVINRDAEGRATMRAIRLDAPLQLDGQLDERVYFTVPPVTDFIQQEPDEGAPARDQTEVWVMFDRDTFYVAARCWSTDPERIIANEMKRDSYNMFGNETFSVVLDTFYDRRNGFNFITNALGALFDATITNERTPNLDWNAVWDVRAGRFEQGWTLEMAIPFKSLRYRTGPSQIWGINFQRNVASTNETSFLTPIPAALAFQGMFRFSSAPTLVGVEVPESGTRLEVKPYAISDVTTDLNATPRLSNDPGGDFGVDVKYGVTQGLTADLTYNTDFAQVEVDEQQVNLTRFSLFFPEKREFFLEGQGIFDFGGGFRGGPTAYYFRGERFGGSAPVLFFSRRIGLNEGRTVPIQGGGRLTGKVGPYSIGLLDVRTGDESVSGTAPTNFAVARLKRDVLRRSAVGALFTGRSVAVDAPGASYTYGVDGVFSFYDNLNVNTYLARTQTPGRRGDDASYQTQLEYSGDRWGFVLDRLGVGANFNPEVGFLRRDDFRRSFGSFRFSPRPRSIAAVRKFLFEGSLDYIADGAGRLETRLQQGIFGIEFENGDRFFGGATDNYEFLDEPFDIHKDVTIPVGGYSFTSARVVYALGQQRSVSGGLTFDRGQFFGGEWTSIGYFRGRINLSPQLSVEPSLSFNWIELPQGAFTTELLATRAIYTLTPRMFVAALLQYNSGADSLGTNIRLRWEYQPGSELFVVYTDERDTLTPRFRGLENRAFVVKFNRLFRF